MKKESVVASKIKAPVKPQAKKPAIPKVNFAIMYSGKSTM